MHSQNRAKHRNNIYDNLLKDITVEGKDKRYVTHEGSYLRIVLQKEDDRNNDVDVLGNKPLHPHKILRLEHRQGKLQSDVTIKKDNNDDYIFQIIVGLNELQDVVKEIPNVETDVSFEKKITKVTETRIMDL